MVAGTRTSMGNAECHEESLELLAAKSLGIRKTLKYVRICRGKGKIRQNKAKVNFPSFPLPFLSCFGITRSWKLCRLTQLATVAFQDANMFEVFPRTEPSKTQEKVDYDEGGTQHSTK